MALFDFEKHQANKILKGFIDDDIEKAKAVPIGTIMTRKSGLVEQKTADGWKTIPKTHPQHPLNVSGVYTDKVKKEDKGVLQVEGKRFKVGDELILIFPMSGAMIPDGSKGKITQVYTNSVDVTFDTGQGKRRNILLTMSWLKDRVRNLSDEKRLSDKKSSSNKSVSEGDFFIHHYSSGPADVYHALSSIDKALKKYDEKQKEEPIKETLDNSLLHYGVIIPGDKPDSNIKVNVRFDEATGTYTLDGKINGGKPYEQKGLSSAKLKEIIDSRLDKVDDDAQNLYSVANKRDKDGRIKEYNKDYKKAFFDDYYNKRATDEQKQLLSYLVGTDNNSWRYVMKHGVDWDSLKEEKIDSRFSNERENYVGMFSGDLIYIAKWTGIIGGKKFQRVGSKSFDTRGFW